MEALFEHIKNELGGLRNEMSGLRTDMTRLDEHMASLEENNASLRQVIADSTRSEEDLSRRTTVLPRSPEYSAKFTPGSVLAANRQRASTLTAEQMEADSLHMHEQEWHATSQKPFQKPVIPPMAQQHRSGITIAMLQEFEHYYQGSKEALIGFQHVPNYRSSDLAAPGRATTFNRLFLAGLHPELHRQALGDMSREDKAMSLSFPALVTELRTYLIDKTIGNDFAEFCHRHRQI
jgi:hypothetical protein